MLAALTIDGYFGIQSQEQGGVIVSITTTYPSIRHVVSLDLCQGALWLVLGVFLLSAIVPSMAAAEGDAATSLVRLYYTLQGASSATAEKTAAGVPAAQELLDEGYSKSLLTELIVEARQDIPGAANQPFEQVIPAYVHGAEPMASHTEASTSMAEPDRHAPVETEPESRVEARSTDISAASRLDQPVRRIKGPAGVILASALVDMVGFLAWSIGGIVTTQSEGGYLAMAIGGTITTVGSFMGTIAMTAWQGQVIRAGNVVRSPAGAGAWILTSLNLGCTIASWAPVGMIGWVAFSGAAVIFELINLTAARMKWARALEGTGVARNDRPLRLSPFVATLRDPVSRETTAVAGIGGVF